MDTKITLSFEKSVIEKAKRFADSHHMSLSRLTEFLYQKITSGNYSSLEDFEISDWVNSVAEGSVTYQTAKRISKKTIKKEFFEPLK